MWSLRRSALTGQLAARMSFGIRGAKVGPSVLRVLASTYWFAFQTIAGALVIVDLLNRITGWNLSAVPVCVLFGLAQVVVAVWGYGWLKVLSRIAFPIKITLLIFLVSLLIRSPQPDFHLGIAARFNHASAFRWALFALWANGMAAGWIVMITDAADFCRYSRSRAHMWFGTILAAVTGCSFCTFLGAYAAAATKGTNPNFFLVVTALEHSPIVLAAVFVVVILDNWTINVLNLYTGGLSLTNVFEKRGRFWATLIVGVFSISLSAAPHLVQGYLRYTTALGNLFAPIAGVMLADYLVIRRMRIDVAALFERGGSYWYLMGFNPAAILTIVAGFWFTTWLPDSSVPTILVVALSGCLYPVVYKIFDKTSGVDTADIQFQEE